MDKLKNKTLIILVGPSAIGKSTLMNEVVCQHPEFGRVTGFTTREPRANDEPGQYRYLSKEEARQKSAQGKLIQYATAPTTGQMYGTEIIDYPATYNLKDILANAVSDFRALPFKGTITISLTAPAKEWQGWFLNRYPTPSREARERLEEAKLSINWSLADRATYWLENPADHIVRTAKELIEIVLTQPPQTTSDEPRAMLELIEKGLWS